MASIIAFGAKFKAFGELTDDRSLDDFGNHRILRHSDWIHPAVRTLEEMTMHWETAAVLLISVAVFFYLLYALLRPEKF